MAKGQTIFISGEAGTGKTRLLNEFINSVSQKNVNLLSGWCLSNTSIPYFPFIEAFNTFYPKIEELLTAIPAATNSSKPFEPNAYKNQQASPQIWVDNTFRIITRELISLSTKKTLIFTLEDIHWADSASLSLLNYLSHSINFEKILILATFRSESLTYDLEGRLSTLFQTLKIMQRDDLYQEIKLTGLTKLEISTLTENILGNQISNNFLEKMSTESQGNPLFIIESLKTLMSNGCLVQKDGQWLVSTDNLTIPSRVKDIILLRASNLKLNLRKILDVSSVVGEKFDYKLVASTLSQEQIQILEKLNSIVRTTALIKFDNNSFCFDHALTREIIYDELPLPLKTSYHQKIAEVLETISGKNRNDIVGELAFHFEKANNTPKTIKYSLLAGKEALAKFSNSEAINYFTHLLKIVDNDHEYHQERISAIEALGDSYSAKGEFKEAQKIYQKLVSLSTDEVKLRAIRKSMSSARWLGNFQYSIELSKEAEACKRNNKLEYGRVQLNKGAALGSFGNTKVGLECLEKATTIFIEEQSNEDLAQALNESASLYQTEGYPDKAIIAARRAISLNQEIGNLRGQVDAFFYAGQVFFNCRLFKEALANFDQALELSEKIGYINRTCWAALYSAIVLDIRGDLETAVEKNLFADKYAEKTDSHYTQSQSTANLLALYSKLNDIKKADKYYTKLKLQFPDPIKAGSKLGYAAIIKAQALFFAAKKDWAKSDELFNLSFNALEGSLFARSFEASMRMDYAMVLNSQSRFVEESAQKKKVLELTRNIERQFKVSKIEAVLTSKETCSVGEPFELRLDLINLSRFDCEILKAIDLFSSTIEVLKTNGEVKLPNFCGLSIQPFGIKSFKFELRVSEEGEYTFAPRFSCQINKFTKVFISKPQKINVKQSNMKICENKENLDNENTLRIYPNKTFNYEFKTESSSKSFDFLLKSFIDDYMRLKLPLERSGWRTSLDVIKHTNAPFSSIYGRKGRKGNAISELIGRGLIEMRFFSGERGRGGKIGKLRICYEREPVKRYVDSRLANAKNVRL